MASKTCRADLHVSAAYHPPPVAAAAHAHALSRTTTAIAAYGTRPPQAAYELSRMSTLSAELPLWITFEVCRHLATDTRNIQLCSEFTLCDETSIEPAQPHVSGGQNMTSTAPTLLVAVGPYIRRFEVRYSLIAGGSHSGTSHAASHFVTMMSPCISHSCHVLNARFVRCRWH
jgi:hypothetical protein